MFCGKEEYISLIGIRKTKNGKRKKKRAKQNSLMFVYIRIMWIALFGFRCVTIQLAFTDKLPAPIY
jgi:hypothetical protein